MSANTDVRAFIGKGQVFLRRHDDDKGLLPIGEVSSLELSIETDEKTLQSNVQSGGGVAATAYSVTDMALSMTLNSFTDDNLAIALNADASAVAGASITDESHKAHPGALVALDKVPDLTESITVTSDPAGTDYVEGADWVRSAGGIRIQSGGSIASATEILVSYTSQDHSIIQMLTNSGYEYQLYFQGLNDADNGKPVLIDLYRTKFSPTSGLGFITDDFAELSLEGKCLSDGSKTGAGVSRYANIKRV